MALLLVAMNHADQGAARPFPQSPDGLLKLSLLLTAVALIGQEIQDAGLLPDLLLKRQSDLGRQVVVGEQGKEPAGARGVEERYAVRHPALVQIRLVHEDRQG